MTAFKGILAGILSFFLMLSLIIFGVSFMVKSTAMNPEFAIDQMNRADITQLTSDIVEEEIIEDIPEDIRFFEDVVFEVIADHESWLKEQFSAAVYDGYDYLLKKTDSLDIRIPLEDI